MHDFFGKCVLHNLKFLQSWHTHIFLDLSLQYLISTKCSHNIHHLFSICFQHFLKFEQNTVTSYTWEFSENVFICSNFVRFPSILGLSTNGQILLSLILFTISSFAVLQILTSLQMFPGQNEECRMLYNWLWFLLLRAQHLMHPGIFIVHR